MAPRTLSQASACARRAVAPPRWRRAQRQRRTAGTRVQAGAQSARDLSDEFKAVEFFRDGPLAAQLDGELSDFDVAVVGARICDDLGFDTASLSEQQARRVYHYYAPVYAWARAQARAKRAAGDAAPLVVGFSAPQGCGKTTLTQELIALFAADGERAVCVSLDDFYLTYAEQSAVAEETGNPLLEFRGNAGSHDVALASETLRRLKGINKDDAGAEVLVPRYDKTANSGFGDRAPQESWTTVEGPLNVVLYEGWMLGFEPVGAEAAAAVNPALVAVDDKLEPYEERIESLADAWLVIQIGDPEWVFDWRSQAEDATRKAGKPALTPEQVRAFVSRFQPAYEAYLPALYRDGPRGAKAAGKAVLAIEVERDRSVKE